MWDEHQYMIDKFFRTHLYLWQIELVLVNSLCQYFEMLITIFIDINRVAVAPYGFPAQFTV